MTAHYSSMVKERNTWLRGFGHTGSSLRLPGSSASSPGSRASSGGTLSNLAAILTVPQPPEPRRGGPGGQPPAKRANTCRVWEEAEEEAGGVCTERESARSSGEAPSAREEAKWKQIRPQLLRSFIERLKPQDDFSRRRAVLAKETIQNRVCPPAARGRYPSRSACCTAMQKLRIVILGLAS